MELRADFEMRAIVLRLSRCRVRPRRRIKRPVLVFAPTALLRVFADPATVSKVMVLVNRRAMAGVHRTRFAGGGCNRLNAEMRVCIECGGCVCGAWIQPATAATHRTYRLNVDAVRIQRLWAGARAVWPFMESAGADRLFGQLHGGSIFRVFCRAVPASVSLAAAPTSLADRAHL